MRLENLIPGWVARPATVLSTLAALTGAGFIFWAAATGSYWWAIWGAISFVGAGLCWYLSDFAAATSPAEPRFSPGP